MIHLLGRIMSAYRIAGREVRVMSVLLEKPFWEVQAMWMINTGIGLGIALALVVLYLLSCIRILNEYQRGVIFRLGRAMPTTIPT